MLAGTASTPSTTAACPTCTCGTSRPRGPDRSTSQSTWHEGGDQATAGIQCNTWLMMSQHRLRVQRGYMRGALCEWGGIEHRVPLADSADLIDAPMLPARMIKSHTHTHARAHIHIHTLGVSCHVVTLRKGVVVKSRYVTNLRIRIHSEHAGNPPSHFRFCLRHGLQAVITRLRLR